MTTQARMDLSIRILIGMGLGFVTGILFKSAGVLVPGWEQSINILFVDGLFDVMGQIFVRMLKLLVVPVVFVSLVCGTCALSNGARTGLIGLKSIGFYLMTTLVAVTLALLLANIVDPGEGIHAGAATSWEPRETPSLKSVFIGMVPDNPVAAMAQASMLQIIVFSLLFGLAISRAGEFGERVANIFQDLYEVVMKLVLLVISLAPYGVFFLVARLFAEMGIGILLELIWYFLTVVAVLGLQAFGTYTLLLKMGGLPPKIFFSKMLPVQLFAFSTASSSATMPLTLETVEHRLGVKNSVASFVVPLGATINMDGTAIMQGVATVFIAQAFQVDIGLLGYIQVMLVATLASIGTAGVPGVGIIMLTIVLQQVGLPVEGIALIIGVDRLLDMLRTAVNVTGDGLISSLVAKSEGQLDEKTFVEPQKH